MPTSGVSGAPPDTSAFSWPPNRFAIRGLNRRSTRNCLGRSVRRRRPALFLDALADPRPQHLEQARDDDHDRRPRLLDIGRELIQPLGIIDLAGEADGAELPGGMFVGVAERQEGQEHLVLPAEILGDDLHDAGDVVQDRAMVMHHPARRAAGARRVDDAGQVVAGEVGDDVVPPRRMIGDQPVPVVMFDRGGKAHLVDTDDDPALAGAQHRGHQHLGELRGRDDHRARARILQDMLVVALRVRDIGRHRHQAGGHDRQVRQAPFRPVLADQHHPVAALQPQRRERRGQARDLPRRLGPARRPPRAVAFRPQERRVALGAGAGEEHRDEIGEMFELTHSLS